MDWQNPHVRAALLNLIEHGEIKRIKRIQALVEHLQNLGWLIHGKRQDWFSLNETGAASLPTLLDQVFPEWQDVLTALKIHSLSLSSKGLEQLRQQTRELPPTTGAIAP